MKKVLIFLSLILELSLCSVVYGTQSISTDIQPYRTYHFDMDNYFSIFDNDTNPYAAGTLLGVTYGIFKNVEVGIDLIEPSADPVYLNFKYGVSETESMPSFSVGVFNVGLKADVNNYNMFYGMAAKTFEPIGRFSLGGYSGNANLLVDENGDKADLGLISSWDKLLSDKIWVYINYTSGNNFYGSFNFGGSYAVSSKTSLFFGYVIYNNSSINPNNQFTAQVDINF